MRSGLVVKRQDVEDEWRHVELQRGLRADKQSRQQTNILTVDRTDVAADFKDRQVIGTIQLTARRATLPTLCLRYTRCKKKSVTE